MKGKPMACQYETDTFNVIRGALINAAETALYMEREHEAGPANPCPDYCAYLVSTIREIGAAESFESLAAVHWVASRAADNM